MPFKRRGFVRSTLRRGRKTFRRRRLPNVNQIKFFTPRNLMSGVNYAVKTANMLKGIINSELKRYDTVIPATPSTTPGLQLLTGMNQGSDPSERDGNSILAKYLSVDIDARINASATATMARVIIFVDGDNDGQTPSAAELLEVATNTGSPINMDQSSRFTILFDNHFPLSINGDRLMHTKRFKKLNFHIKYRTATGSSGFGQNNIWAYYISSEATNVPDINIYSRLAYYDN